MKRMMLCVLLCSFVLCGCSAEANSKVEYEQDEAYSVGYEEGYDAGYNDAFEGNLNNPDYSDDLRSFQSAIADLMYDHEYEIVKKLMEYNKKGVESELEVEFGSRSIETIIEYLDNLSKTVKGKCEICGESVYFDDFAFLPEGIACAHSKCLSGNTSGGSMHIDKDE